MYSPLNPIVGLSQMTPIFDAVADTAPSVTDGTIVAAIDPWWGGAEFVYAKAEGAIRNKGLVMFVPTFDATDKRWNWDATELADSANLGRSVGVAVRALADEEYGWFQITGLTPVNCDADVAADTAFGVAATGQGGALTAGKEILNARVAAPATTTVAKTNCYSEAGSYEIEVTNSDGWFIGAYMSGTGVGANAKITKISPDGRRVTVDVVSTARITGTVTATYNNATIFYNVVFLNRPHLQGQDAVV